MTNFDLIVCLFLCRCIAMVHCGSDDDFFPVDKCNWGVDPMSSLCIEASRTSLIHMGSLDRTEFYKKCAVNKFGGRDAHWLCNRNMIEVVSKDCVFYSYGVSTDYSFDVQLAHRWNCSGILLDPSINHPSQLAPGLKFFPIGAPMLNLKEQGGAGSLSGIAGSQWLTASPVQLKRLFMHHMLAVLKMDCEGCEYAIVRDLFIFQEPRFFQSVEQFAFEAHVSKAWASTDEHVHYLGLLFHVLFREGFELVRWKVGGCYRPHEMLGCIETLANTSFPCGRRKMCHEYTFSRV